MFDKLSINYVPRFFQRFFVRETAEKTIIDQQLEHCIRLVAGNLTVQLSPYTIQQMNGRLERGLEMALSGAVKADPIASQPHRFKMLSSDGCHFYTIDLDAKTCDCPDSQKGNHCKHRIAAFLYKEGSEMKQKNAQQEERSRPAQPAARPIQQPPAQPKPGQAPSREEQILKELGFDAEPKKLAEAPVSQPGARLGSLYRRYLHGEELDQKPIKVTITNITKETVTPHPSQPSYEKWCLWVSGLPQGIPCGILFGAEGERELVSIFGRVGIESLKGKTMMIYPQPMSVAGQSRIAIRFRSAQ